MLNHTYTLDIKLRSKVKGENINIHTLVITLQLYNVWVFYSERQYSTATVTYFLSAAVKGLRYSLEIFSTM